MHRYYTMFQNRIVDLNVSNLIVGMTQMCGYLTITDKQNAQILHYVPKQNCWFKRK